MYGHIYGKTLVVDVQRDRRQTTLLRRVDKALAAALDRLQVWQERVRSRRMLRGLDDHMLHDIGIDRSIAEQEASMPFWR
jgi:uncharacterized protein YjiS (DUF1127 family)